METLLTYCEKKYIQKRTLRSAVEVDGYFFWIRRKKEKLFLIRTYHDRKPGLHIVSPSKRKQVRGQGRKPSPVQKAIWKI